MYKIGFYYYYFDQKKLFLFSTIIYFITTLTQTRKSLMWLPLPVLLAIEILIVCGGTPNDFNSEGLLVVTVIDTSSASIIRDSMTLFRSVRLYGGSFNDAIFKACIILKKTNSPDVVDLELLQNLNTLNISYEFMYSVPDNVSPTLNKFVCLKAFSAHQFEYILWLDADIFIFQDPVPYFSAALTEAKESAGGDTATVYCAVEVYNYLERYPQVNESDLIWNRKLSPFTIYDVTASNELRVVPHGTCNTGVLLFSRPGFTRFLDNLPSNTILDELDAFGYSGDRFIDSLLFVMAVNAAGLVVHQLDYALNYLAFVQSMHLLSDNPVFAHFIGTTYFFCYPLVKDAISQEESDANTDGLPLCSGSISPDQSEEPTGACISCSCIYFDENREPSRNIVRKMNEVRVMEKCLELAGLVPIAQSQQLLQVEDP
jgi:hypothetical protein